MEKSLKDSFTHEELLAILETARYALSDADTYHWIAEELDLDDSTLKPLQEKLQKVLN